MQEWQELTTVTRAVTGAVTRGRSGAGVTAETGSGSRAGAKTETGARSEAAIEGTRAWEA